MTTALTFNYSFPVQDNRPDFQCRIMCNQCNARKPTGDQCGNRVCIGTPFCWIHLEKMYRVRIRDSDYGKGLFASDKKIGARDIVFRPGELIVPYFGDRVDTATIDARYGEDYTSPYAVELVPGTGLFEDAACKRGVGSLVNHGNTRRSRNAILSYNEVDDEVQVIATKNIRNNIEILVDYGDDYRFQGEGTDHQTKRRRVP